VLLLKFGEQFSNRFVGSVFGFRLGHSVKSKPAYAEKILDLADQTTLEFSSVEAIKRCVMAGVGVTILPEIAVAEEISQKRLVDLPYKEGKFDTALLMIWYKERWLSPTLNAFIRMTRKVLGNM